MHSFLSLLRFELRYQVFSPVFVVSFAVFFLLAFFGTASEQVTIGGPSSVNINAPGAIAMTLGILGLFAIFIPAAMLSSAVIRDRDFKTEELFHSTPLSPRTFLLGRLSGALIATWLAFASVPLAMFIAALMPWIDPERLGPMEPMAYLELYGVVSMLNLTVVGLLLFTVANLTRSTFATYIALTAFLILWITGNVTLNQAQFRELAALIDPLGFNAMQYVTRYWTPAQNNTEMIPLDGVLLTNRLIWLGVGVALLVFNLATFSFRKRMRRAKRKEETAERPAAPVKVELPRVAPETRPSMAQLATRIRFESKAVVKNAAFWILMILGLVNTVASLSLGLDLMYGTPSYPMTRIMVQVVQGSFGIIPLIVSVYYASELVWRERAAGISEVIDATPTPSWVFVVSKFFALSLVVLSMFVVALASAIAVQLAKGHSDLELGQYLLRFAAEFVVPSILLAVFCLFLQVVTNNRWLGIIGVVLYIIVTEVAANFGYDYNLLIYGETPSLPYSDMDGYGHHLGITGWYFLYWGSWALVLGTLTYLLWNRGALRPLRERIAALPRMSGASRGLVAAGLVGALLSGSWIFYNTNIVNDYTNKVRLERLALDYEDRYRKDNEHAPRPTITAVDLAVDLYPRARRSEFAGTYSIVNRTKAPLRTLLVDYAYPVEVISQKIAGGTVEEEDEKHNVYRVSLNPPLAPGETRSFAFETRRRNEGFKNSGNGSEVNWNGTFLNNSDALPFFGFNTGKLLQPRNDRRRYDRESLPRAPDLDDERYFRTNLLRPDSALVDFSVTISTVPEQIAIAPGYLDKEWLEDGRRYFRYVMDKPINNFFSFQSAEYAVKEDEYDDVKLQVFYHPAHGYNVDRMMESMKKSFDYFNREFSPYQYQQMRILEFPAYARFAQSFSNTVPYSESIGFVMDLRDEKDIDVVFYVTAHEIAHQWWGHQVTPSPHQGATMLVETFAQYGALMVMEQEYGAHAMRRFLKEELHSYLSGRAAEPEGETPLYRVEDQGYIHYRKGALVMYALKEYVGEDVVNRSLSRLIDEWAYKTDPYPRSVDYLKILREEAGPEHDALIADLFEKIVLFDLRVTDAEVTARTDGRFDLTMTVSAKKLESDEKGNESEVPLEMPIDVGVFSKSLEDVYRGDEHVIVLEKRTVKSDENTFTFTVDETPVEVGIDPYNTLIDRVIDDNVRTVTVSEQSGS